jgi:dihydroorotate dehydrogenase (fumarate)
MPNPDIGHLFDTQGAITVLDLSTTYLGLQLKNPIVPSASPLSHSLAGIKQLEDAGASAVVMYSLFEEQIEKEAHLLDHYMQSGAESHAEALSYFPSMRNYNVGPDAYLELIRKAKSQVDIPIIGSLNGVTPGGWLRYAREIEQAGADALEINMYYVPTDIDMRGDQVEQRYIDILSSVKRHTKIPIAMKLSPFFSSPANIAKRLMSSGAAGLVLFNRFYQPDFELGSLSVVPRLRLSDSDELRLPLRWVAILFGRLPIDFAIRTGVHTHEDVLKGLMAGACVTMMASALLQNGVERIGQVLRGIEGWMEMHEYESVAQLRGSMSQRRVAQPDAFERANYMKVLDSWYAPILRDRSDYILFNNNDLIETDFAEETARD